MTAPRLITDNLDLWTAAVTPKANNGRGNNGQPELTGIKKLRELILELAVRGKLVPQNPTDEPASALLKKIAVEKARLVKEGKIKKPKPLPAVGEGEQPFELPAGWEWVRLENIGRDWGQKKPDRTFSYIDVAAIDNKRGKISSPYVLEPSAAPSRARKLVAKGTIIYSTVRPYLQNIAVVEHDFDPEPIVSTAFAIIHPLVEMPARFFLHYLRSPSFVKYVESVQTGIAYPAVNDKQFFSGLAPIPPLAEQHRIVEKVDELMALCDRLEQQTNDQLAAHETLVETLLDTLTRSADATELATNWTRLQTHFDTLFTTESSIDRLKQTILQLAVMGRLVPQDPNDEPASALLKKIAAEKARLVKEGKIKRPKPLPPVGDDEKPLDVPSGWKPIRIGKVIHLISGQHLKGEEYSVTPEPGSIPYLTGPAEFGDLFPLPTRYTAEKRAVACSGDILVTCKGSGVGKLNRADKDIAISRQLMAVRPVAVDPDFLFVLLDSLRDTIRKNIVGIAIPGISREDITDTIALLPPWEEQRRIVQKIDELMNICGRLKARLSQANQTQQYLAETVVTTTLV